MTTWKRTILESPYAGDVENNRLYALACLKDMFERGEAGFASHVLYPRFLEKYNLEQRRAGISAGQAWLPVTEQVAIYTDLGISSGMYQGISLAERLKIKIVERKLGWQL